MHIRWCIQNDVFWVVVGKLILLDERGKSRKITLAATAFFWDSFLKVIEKERAEKGQKLDELKRSGHILLDQMGKGKQLRGCFSLL